MATAAELLASACASGISCLGEKSLLVIIAQGAMAGGGGGGSGPYVLKAGDTMTGALILPNGSAAAPSLGVGGTTSGLFRPAVNQLGITTAGVQRMVVDASGMVGIGTTAPISALTVVGTTLDTLVIGESNAATGKHMRIGYDVAGDYGVIQAAHETVAFTPLVLNPSGGNVGIGTGSGSPSEKLTIKDGNLLFDLTAGVNQAALGIDALTGNGARITFQRNGTNDDYIVFSVLDSGVAAYPYAMVINYDSNVGIGLPAPLARLHVKPSASGTDYFRIDHSDGTARFQLGVYPGQPAIATIWMGDLVPSDSNYILYTAGASSVSLNAPTALFLGTGNGVQWNINAAGHLIATTDNTNDIGAGGANRPRHVYIAGNLVAGVVYSNIFRDNTTGIIQLQDGNTGTTFDRLQFGGATSSYPSIKRSSATLQARLSDDSGFADLSVANVLTNNAAALIKSSVAMTDGAAAQVGTLTNAPAAGNPTKWIPIVDNGVTRHIPSW